MSPNRGTFCGEGLGFRGGSGISSYSMGIGCRVWEMPGLDYSHISYSEYFLHNFNGHGFLIRDYIKDYTKLQEGPLCPLLRSLQ